MRRTSIQTRIFVSFSALALFITCVLSVVFYRYAAALLTRRELEAFSETAGNIRERTDTALRTLDDISINIGYSGLVRDRVTGWPGISEPLQNRFSELAGLFVSINGPNYPACQIFLYDNEGGRIGVGLVNRDERVDLDSLGWVEPTLALRGKKYVGAPYSTSFYLRTTSVSPWYVSLYRTYSNRFGKQTGFLEVVQSYKTIFKSAISYTKRNPESRIYIFNDAGELIYPAENAGDVSFYYRLASEQSTRSASIQATDPSTGEKQLAAVELSSYSDWTYVYARPSAEVLAPVNEAGFLLLAALAVVIPLTVALSYFAAQKITRPLKRLVFALRETSLDTLGEAAFTATRVDEIDELNEAFGRMGADLRRSMNELLETRAQEQRSRSLALQSQINPHFYYNSLSSIMILAENGKTDEVAAMCKSLSGIMRYITDSSSSVVTLGSELDYVEKYLYCMKVRYQSSLTYTVTVDEELKQQRVPRLIIQPLVENALKYGANCAPPWSVEIFSTLRPDYWTISVRDSGPGFTAAALKLTHERIKESDATTGMPRQQINGMGLINVYSRWRLFAGDSMLFEFANASPAGAIVSIGRLTPESSSPSEKHA